MEKTVHYFSLVEGLSLLLLLFIAMPVKYLAGDPSLVRIVGMVHGILFLGFVCLVFVACYRDQWSRRLILVALVTSSVPFGMFVLSREMKKHYAVR